MVSESLIKRSCQNDRMAHKLLYEACAPYLFGVIRNYLGNQGQNRDTLQDVFARIFYSLKSFDADKASFKTWITQICIYTCIDELKKNNKLQLSSLDIAEAIEPVDTTYMQLEQMSRGDIETYLGKMPEGYKTIFLLFYIDEYSHKEIAQLLDISVGTSRSQLNRGLNWIRKNLSVNLKSLRNELV